MKLYAPKAYWEMSKEAIDEITGGCGPGGLGDWLVPDTIWFLNIKPSCRIHDFMYYFGATLNDPTDECNKEKSDRVFLNNMLRMVKAKTRWGWLKRLRRRRAKTYYFVVKEYGSTAFWNGKNADNEEMEVA